MEGKNKPVKNMFPLSLPNKLLFIFWAKIKLFIIVYEENFQKGQT